MRSACIGGARLTFSDCSATRHEQSATAANAGVQGSAALASLALYMWTLLAPYLLRDVRDFGIEFDFD